MHTGLRIMSLQYVQKSYFILYLPTTHDHTKPFTFFCRIFEKVYALVVHASIYLKTFLKCCAPESLST